jgi:hypothetical protein
MSPIGLETAILESERPQTHAIDRATTKLFLNALQNFHLLRQESKTHAKKQTNKQTFSFGISIALLLIFFFVKNLIMQNFP